LLAPLNKQVLKQIKRQRIKHALKKNLFGEYQKNYAKKEATLLKWLLAILFFNTCNAQA
jgi:hypothetical protein